MYKSNRRAKKARYPEAKKMYLDLKDRPFYHSNYLTAFFSDFMELEKQGVSHPDIERIRALLKEEER